MQAGIIETIYTQARRPILQRLKLPLEPLRVLLRLCFEGRLISEQ
jgi:hypothetical protein